MPHPPVSRARCRPVPEAGVRAGWRVGVRADRTGCAGLGEATSGAGMCSRMAAP
ncbi:MAG: hypothetical protein KIT69_02355 [Propionibacteriaceae bacterium]|nr:hypothetical protein [Propionibacteriaceae bacterium]